MNLDEFRWYLKVSHVRSKRSETDRTQICGEKQTLGISCGRMSHDQCWSQFPASVWLQASYLYSLYMSSGLKAIWRNPVDSTCSGTDTRPSTGSKAHAHEPELGRCFLLIQDIRPVVKSRARPGMCETADSSMKNLVDALCWAMQHYAAMVQLWCRPNLKFFMFFKCWCSSQGTKILAQTSRHLSSPQECLPRTEDAKPLSTKYKP